MTEEGIPLDGDILSDCVNQLHLRLRDLVATGQSINERYPAVIETLFTPQERAGVMAIAARVKTRWEEVKQRRKDIDIT